MKTSLLLRCKNLTETETFYRETLGFKTSECTEDSCTLRHGDAHLIFTESNLWDHPPFCSGTFYFYPSDVDVSYETLKHKVTIRWPLQDMPYGTREFGFEDCNGYLLAFAN